MPRSVLILFSIVLLGACLDVLSAQSQETKRDDPVEASKTLDHLIEMLDAGDSGKQMRAVEKLRSMGDLALPALPALIRALEDDSESIRIEAAKTLGSLGPAAKDALPKLIAQLDNAEVRLVNPVAMAIGFIGGPDNKSVVRRLIILKMLKGGGALIHWSYLGTFPQASLENLIELLNDENDLVRQQAATVIGDMLRGAYSEKPLLLKTAVTRGDLGPPLIAVLNDESISVRIAAAKTLASLDQKHSNLLIPTVVDALGQLKISYQDAARLIQPAANEAIPFLIAALEHEDEGPQSKISMTIAMMPKESLPFLAKASSHGSARVRAGVASSLGGYPFRKLNREAASALLSFLQDEDAEVRLRSAESMVSLGVLDSELTVSVLTRLLEDKQPKRRARAAKTLCAIGPAARASVPNLLTTLGDDQPDVRIHAAIALVSIDKSQGPATLSTLHAAIQPLDENAGFQLRSLQTSAMVAIGELGPAADQLAGSIVEFVVTPRDKTNLHIQLASAEALIKVSKPNAHLGIAKLTEIVVHGRGRKLAIEALVRQAQHAKPSVEPLLEVAKGNRSSYREYAAVAAIKIDPEKVEGWNLLRQSFKKEGSLRIDRGLNSLIQYDIVSHPLLGDLESFLGETHGQSSLVKAITLIGNVGPSAKSVAPTLTKLLKDEQETVQQAAREALMKIQSKTTNSITH